MTSSERYERLFYLFMSISVALLMDGIILPNAVGFSVSAWVLQQIFAVFTNDPNTLATLLGALLALMSMGFLATGLAAGSFYRSWKRAEAAAAGTTG